MKQHPKAPRKIYLIDGVKVPRRTWEQRKIFGEYMGAKFEIVERTNDRRFQLR